MGTSENNGAVQQPWDDCKVAFSIKDYKKIEAEWDLRDGVLDTQLPPGWQVNAISCTGARVAVIFRVEVPLRQEDGEKVREILQRLELTN